MKILSDKRMTRENAATLSILTLWMPKRWALIQRCKNTIQYSIPLLRLFGTSVSLWHVSSSSR